MTSQVQSLSFTACRRLELHAFNYYHEWEPWFRWETDLLRTFQPSTHTLLPNDAGGGSLHPKTLLVWGLVIRRLTW